MFFLTRAGRWWSTFHHFFSKNHTYHNPLRGKRICIDITLTCTAKRKKNQYFVFFLWNKPNYPPGEFKFKWGNKWQTSGGTWGNFSLKCCLGSLGKWAKPVPLTLIFHLQLNNSNQACRASNYFTHVEAAFMGLYCELLLSLPFRNQNTKSNIEGVAKPKKCAIRVGC